MNDFLVTFVSNGKFLHKNLSDGDCVRRAFEYFFSVGLYVL